MSSSLRGVKCNVCGALGQHYSSACPHRNQVGVPLGMQQEDDDVQSVHTAEIGPVFLQPGELDAIISKRPEIPTFLRCRVCYLLPEHAMWCACCDVVACEECLRPAHTDWMCPACGGTAVDNFHVVSALRSVIRTWFISAASAIDFYSKDG